MNEATINIFNAIAFPPAQVSSRVTGDPFFTRQDDPVYTAIAREFGRLGFLLLLALIAAVALIVSAVQALSPAGPYRAQTPGANSAPVAVTSNR